MSNIDNDTSEDLEYITNKIAEEELVKKVDLTEECPMCYGSHRFIPPGSYTSIECPRCKNTLSSTAVNTEITIENDVDELTRLMIPENYWNKAFDSAKIEHMVNSDPDTVNSAVYMRIIREVYSAISVGKKYKNSLLIYSPIGCGKDEFVFTCMQVALNNNLTVAPYVDTNQLDQIVTGTIYDNPSKRMGIEKFTLGDIVNPDYCFIKIKMAGINLKRDLQLLQMIVDQRARQGKPTIILSNFHVGYLTSAEKTYDRFCVTEQRSYEYSRPLFVALQTNYQRNNSYKPNNK